MNIEVPTLRGTEREGLTDGGKMSGSRQVVIPDLAASSDSDDDSPVPPTAPAEGEVPLASPVFCRTDAWETDWTGKSSRHASVASPDPLGRLSMSSPAGGPPSRRESSSSWRTAEEPLPDVYDESETESLSRAGRLSWIGDEVDVGLSNFLTESRVADHTYQAAHDPIYSAVEDAKGGGSARYGPPKRHSLPAAFPPQTWVGPTDTPVRRPPIRQPKTSPVAPAPRRASIISPTPPKEAEMARIAALQTPSAILRNFLPSNVRRRVEEADTTPGQGAANASLGASGMLASGTDIQISPTKRLTPHEVRVSRVRDRNMRAAETERASPLAAAVADAQSPSELASPEPASLSSPGSDTLVTPPKMGHIAVTSPTPPPGTPPSAKKTKSQMRRQQRANAKAKREKAEARSAFRDTIGRAMHGRFPNAELLYDSEGSFGPALRSMPLGVESTVPMLFALSGLRETEVSDLVVGLLANHPAGSRKDAPVVLPYPIVSLGQVILHNKRVLVTHVQTADSPAEARQSLRKLVLPGLPGPLGDILLPGPSEADLKALETPACCWYHSSGTDPASLAEAPGSPPQTTVALLPVSTFTRSSLLRNILQRSNDEQFDMVGVRLIYLTTEELHNLGGEAIISRTEAVPSDADDSGSGEDLLSPTTRPSRPLIPVAVIALRRASAIATWSAVVGPEDPTIARRTDPKSIRALLGKEREDSIMVSSRSLTQARQHLAVCFGRRFFMSADGPADPASLLADASVNYLSTSVLQSVGLVVNASLVLPAIGQWWTYLSGAGFSISAFGRARLEKEDLHALKFPADFSHSKSGGSAGYVWILSKERAVHFARVALERAPDAVLGQLANETSIAPFHIVTDRQGIARLNESISEPPSHDATSKRLACSTSLFTPRWHPELPHCVVVTVAPQFLHRLGGWLVQLLADGGHPSLQVIGTKWISEVRQFQAKELTPHEVGDPEYRSSVSQLAASSLLLVAVYGVTAHKRVQQSLAQAKLPVGNGCEVSPTASIAWRQLSIFFLDSDLHVAPDMDGPCLPPADLRRRPFLLNLAPEATLTQTVAIIKPGCPPTHALRALWAIHRAGFKFTKMELCVLSHDAVMALLKSSPTEFPGAEDPSMATSYAKSLTGARCWVLGLERVNAVAAWRSIMGKPTPAAAREADEFSLRAVFHGLDAVNNELFGSESYNAAVTEAVVLLQPSGYNLSRTMEAGPADVASLHETSVLVVTNAVLESVAVPELIEDLKKWGFDILAATRRGVTLEEADNYVAIESAESAVADVLRGQRIRAALTAGPCLVLAVERENAVTCSEMLLARDGLKAHYGAALFASRSSGAAEAACRLFFPTSL